MVLVKYKKTSIWLTYNVTNTVMTRKLCMWTFQKTQTPAELSDSETFEVVTVPSITLMTWVPGMVLDELLAHSYTKLPGEKTL